MKTFCLTIALLIAQALMAQRPEEWLQQKETALRYQIEQLLALKGYAEVVWKGYIVAQEGLAVIHQIKENDFRLHDAYITSFWTVRPSIQNATLLSKVRALQRSIRRSAQDITALLTQSFLKEDKRSYLLGVLEVSAADVESTTIESDRLFGNNIYGMKDNERLERMVQLMEVLLHQQGFIQHLASELKIVSAARLREQGNIERIKRLQGIR